MVDTCLITNDPLPWLSHRALFHGPNQEHRIWLTRPLREGPIKPVVFALHNPSTANAELNDPTVRRGLGFSVALDGSHLVFWNPCSLRATKANTIPVDAELTCEQNWLALDAALKLVKHHDGIFIAAWGAPKGRVSVQHRIRELQERTLFYAAEAGVQVHALRITDSGHPEHPLYLPADLRPIPYNLPNRARLAHG